MSNIGEQIKKYRIEKGITQEQLGNLIGVTTQAVSRWERGGTPDAEVIPAISDVLGVSTDALFGREQQSFALSLARQLSSMAQEKAFQYAFSICWAIEIGLVGDVSAIDDFLNKYIDYSMPEEIKNNNYYAKIIFDSGIANARLAPDFKHFFLLSETDSSSPVKLSDTEKLRKVFSVFADKKLLSIIIYIYSKPNMPIASSLISKQTGIELHEVDRCMEILCKNNITTHTVIATAEGEINAYAFRKESFAVPLLCFADEIAQDNLRPFFGGFERKKPLL